MHFQKFEIKFVTPKMLESDFLCTIELSVSATMGTTRPAFNFQSWCFLNNPYVQCSGMIAPRILGASGIIWLVPHCASGLQNS